MPVPTSVADVGVFAASLLKEMLTEAAPIDSGVKITVKFTLSPAGMTRGNESPLSAKSELEMSAAETVTLAPLALRDPA